MKVNSYRELIGNTYLLNLKCDEADNIDLFVKLECLNPSGSVKDRAAAYVIDKLLENNEINKDTLIVESSSGNFAIALGTYCRYKNIKFACVIDPKTTAINEGIIYNVCDYVYKVDEPDSYGGYLINRLKKVKEITSSLENSYWVNQYGNKYIAEAYCNTIGVEIVEEMENIDYIFIAVSSGGTITGVSQKVKEKFPNAKVIAVDIKGSVIFGDAPSNRNISGIGSSIVPDLLQYAKIDEVIWVTEEESIEAYRLLLQKYSIFSGGSSGSLFAAIMKYFKDKTFIKKPKVVTIFPDRGERYVDCLLLSDKSINKTNE